MKKLDVIKDSWIVFLIGIIILSISGIISYYSLFGYWEFKVLGIPSHFNWDPGGAYLGSGITFFNQRYISWVGHPGIPLMALIQVIARSLYGCALIDGISVPFEAYAAKNMVKIILVSKLAISLMHMLSFYVLYIFALKLLKKKEMALLTVLAYATTYPVLFYFNNISPEPIMLLFTLLAILFIWKYLESAYKHNNLRAYGFIVFAAFATACALLTKMMITAPLALFICLLILAHPHSLSGNEQKLRLKQRIGNSIIYLFFFGLFIIIIGWKINWNKFFEFWFYYSPGTPKYLTSHSWFANLYDNMGCLGIEFIKIMPKIFSLLVPRFDNIYGRFIAVELLFLLFSVFGTVRLWIKEREKRKSIEWMVVFILMITPVYINRGLWHYLFIHLAFFSIFFSYFVYDIIDKMIKLSRKYKIMVSAIAIILVHSLSIYYFIDSKLYDIKSYKDWKPYYDALNEIDYNEKIGLEKSTSINEIFGHMFNYVATSSALYDKISSYFIVLDDKNERQEIIENNIRIIISNTSQGAVLKRVGQ